MVQKSIMKATLIILSFFFASVIGQGVKEVRLANGFWRDCGGVNIGIKIVSGRNECTVVAKQRVWGNSLVSWRGAELGNCLSFPVDGSSTVYFQTASATDGFCPELAQIYMDDSRNTRYHARSNHWFSFYYRAQNTQAHGVTKEWPIDGHYIRPQNEPLICPALSDDTCPLQEMYAYKVGSRDRKNCLFECPNIKSISKSTNYHETVGTGYRCVDLDYDSFQFDWCCKTKSTEGGIPHCPDVLTGSSNQSVITTTTTTTTEIPEVSSEAEVPTRAFAVPGVCPESGCPYDQVKTYYEASRVNEICEIRYECDYVKSADPYDPESGVECTRTRTQRRKKSICCNTQTAESNLPQCSSRNNPPVQNNDSAAGNTTVPQSQNDGAAGTNDYTIDYSDSVDNQSQERLVNVGSLADGCPNDGFPRVNLETIENPGDHATGAVRCCSHDGSLCVSPDTPCSVTTFEVAKGICNSKGKRICKREELGAGKCCQTGCRFDGELVWQMN